MWAWASAGGQAAPEYHSFSWQPLKSVSPGVEYVVLTMATHWAHAWDSENTDIHTHNTH